MRVMGIDGALASTGIAVADNNVPIALTKIRTSKCVATPDESARIQLIFKEITHLLTYYKPNVVIAENQHVNKRNPQTSLLLARVRGVMQLACAMQGIPFLILEPTEIKRGVTGKGNAKKELVQEKVKELYPDSELVQTVLAKIITSGAKKTDDIADALAAVYTYCTSPDIAVSA